jgi:hypothetical protein
MARGRRTSRVLHDQLVKQRTWVQLVPTTLLFCISTYLDKRGDFDHGNRRGSIIIDICLCSVGRFPALQGPETYRESDYNSTGPHQQVF